MRSPVTYSKEMRAKADYGLACIDINPHKGTRITFWGPMNKMQHAELMKFWRRMIELQDARPKAKRKTQERA